MEEMAYPPGWRTSPRTNTWMVLSFPRETSRNVRARPGPRSLYGLAYDIVYAYTIIPFILRALHIK